MSERAEGRTNAVQGPAQSVPGLGHALHQVNRPVPLCGLATRYMGK